MQTKLLKDLTCDVIMPVWARDDETMVLTRNAIDSLRPAANRIIIIDNGSTIGGGLMRQWADVYVRNKENLGYAKAVNQGLKLTKHTHTTLAELLQEPIVAVANNDIRVSPNWWEIAKDILQDTRVGSVHYRMIPYEQPFNPGIDTWKEGRERWCSSSFFVMRNMHFYDEGFLNSLDDLDYWRRFRELGGSTQTAYTNRAEYQHLDSWTQQKIGARSENDAKNLAYYIEKWGEHPDAWLERMYPSQMAVPWRPFP